MEADDSRRELEVVFRKQLNEILLCRCDKSAPLPSSKVKERKNLVDLGQFQPANQMEIVILVSLFSGKIYYFNTFFV